MKTLSIFYCVDYRAPQGIGRRRTAASYYNPFTFACFCCTFSNILIFTKCLFIKYNICIIEISGYNMNIEHPLNNFVFIISNKYFLTVGPFSSSLRDNDTTDLDEYNLNLSKHACSDDNLVRSLSNVLYSSNQVDTNAIYIVCMHTWPWCARPFTMGPSEVEYMKGTRKWSILSRPLTELFFVS